MLRLLGSKRLWLVVAALAIALFCIPCFIACGGKSNTGSGDDGTYFLYENDEVDNTCFIKINNNKWSDSDGLNGSLKIVEKEITLYLAETGEALEYLTGTISSGVITITTYNLHNPVYFCKNGRTPPKDSNGDSHEHSFDNTSHKCLLCNYIDPAMWTKTLLYETVTENGMPTGYAVIGNESSSVSEIYIPETHKGKPVTHIQNNAFSSFNNLTRVEIPNSVTVIGEWAFQNCSSLTRIDIPYGVTSVNGATFINCSSLANITIPDSVTSIGNDAFRHCTALTSLRIPKNVTSVGTNIVSGCTALSNITVDSRNTTYHSNGNCLIETQEKALIAGCKNSTIPNDGSVTRIAPYAFRDCDSLTNIIIPNAVTIIGTGAFLNCDGLTDLFIPNGVTEIKKDAFRECETLATVIIGGDVEKIEESAFRECPGLSSVTFANSPTNIGNYAFQGCTNLAEVTFGDYITNLGKCAFSECSSLTSVTIPGSVSRIDEFAFSYCYNMIHATIGSGVSSIGKYAFTSCRFPTIFIPNSVTFIDEYAFYDCMGTEIRCEATEKPSRWSSKWNYYMPDRGREATWGAHPDEYAA